MSIIKLNSHEQNLKLSYRSQLDILVPRLIQTLDNYLISNNLPNNSLLKLQSWQLDINSFYYYLYTLNNNQDYDRFFAFNNVLPAPSMMSLEYNRDKIRKKINYIVDQNGETMLEIIFEYHPIYKTHQNITLKLKKNKNILENTKKFLINLFSDKYNFVNFLNNFTTKPSFSKKKSKKKTTHTIDTFYRPNIEDLIYLQSIPINKSQAKKSVKSSNITLPTKFKIIPRYKKNKSLNFKLTKSKNNIITNYNSLDLLKSKSKKYKFYSIGGKNKHHKKFGGNTIKTTVLDNFLIENFLPTLEQTKNTINSSSKLEFYYDLYMVAADTRDNDDIRELRYQTFHNPIFKHEQIMRNGDIVDKNNRLIARKPNPYINDLTIVFNKDVLIDTYNHLISKNLTEQEYPKDIRDKFRKKFDIDKKRKRNDDSSCEEDPSSQEEGSSSMRNTTTLNSQTEKSQTKKRNLCTIQGGVGSDSEDDESIHTIFNMQYIDEFLEDNNLPTFKHLRSLSSDKLSRSWNSWDGLHFYYILLGLQNNPVVFGNLYKLNKRKPIFDDFGRQITSEDFKLIYDETILVDTYLYLIGEIFNYGSVTEFEYPEKLRKKFYKEFKELIEERRKMLINKLPNNISETLTTSLSNIGKKRKNSSVNNSDKVDKIDKMSIRFLLSNPIKKPPIFKFK